MRQIRHLFQRPPPVFSLVVAAYNVAPYIDDFFASIIAQTYGTRGVEVIVVNDGSTDDTGRIIDAWVKRYPKLIRCLSQKNGGVAVARNAGMAKAQGVWIGFPDPDDMLHPDYLTKIAQVTAPDDTQVAIVANLIRYFEETGEYHDTHPMRYRFQRGAASRPVHKIREMILQSVSHAVFRRASISAHNLTFDPTIRPTFEDGHFANALLIYEAAQKICFVPEAIYYYRKRAASNSAVDTSHDDPRWFTTQLETGYLSLIKLAQEVHGSVPIFIQVNCMYSMIWRFSYLMDRPDRAAVLNGPEQAMLIDHLARIFTVVDKDVIMRFRCAEIHKVALLARYAKGTRNPLRVQPVKLSTDEYEFLWYIDPNTPVELTAKINGVTVEAPITLKHESLFLDQPYVRQDGLQLRLRAGDVVSLHAQDGREVCLRDRGCDLGPTVDTEQLDKLRPVPGILTDDAAQNGEA